MKDSLMPKINSYKKDGLEFLEITNNVGMVVTFTSFGGALYSIKLNGEYMTYQAKEVEDFKKENIFNGKCLGRVAGRIKGDKLVIGSKKYKLHANEDGNVLHGGVNAISTKTFSQRVFNTTGHVHVVYTYFSTNGEAGFPGNALFEIHYIVSDDLAKIKVKLLSYVTEKCPISMTSHTYFSLGEGNLKNTSLKINASKVLDINPNDLILGNEMSVPSYLDFRKAKPVLKDIDNKAINVGKLKGYDHAYIFDEVDDEIPQVVMENDKYRLNVFTDFDSTLIYTDNLDLGFEADNSKEKTRRGIAIEPQCNPSKDLILARGDEFSYFVRYEFEKK